MLSLNGAVGPSSSLDNGEIQREPALFVRRIATGRASTVIAQPYGVKSAVVSIAPNDVNLPAMIDETDDLKAIPGALSCGSLPVEAGHQTVWHVPDTSPWPVICLALAKCNSMVERRNGGRVRASGT